METSEFAFESMYGKGVLAKISKELSVRNKPFGDRIKLIITFPRCSAAIVASVLYPTVLKMSIMKSKSAIPIYRINDDILSLIVQINAKMFEQKGALLFTLNASQVCHAWREALISSPSLWARLLDIDQLRRMADWWGHEVLRRAGNAPLWIKSTEVGRNMQRETRFLMHVLDTRWENVERLYIRTSIVYSGEKTVNFGWDPLFRPAPLLQELGLYIAGLEHFLPLLGDHAPSLRVFRGKDIRFSAHASWLSGLRSVTVGHSSLADIMQMLQGTPLLESLRIENLLDTENDALHRPLSDAGLRRLKHLDISSSQLRACSSLLEHLRVLPSCSLIIPRIFIPEKDTLGHILNELLHPLYQFMDRYLAFHPTSTISISQSSKTFSLEDNTGRFAITMALEGKIGFTEYIVDIIMGAFSPGLSKTTALKFGSFRSPPGAIDVLISFLPKLPLLNILETDERFVLRLYVAQEDNPEILLPTLHTIKLDTFNVSFLESFGGNNEENRSALFNYLVWRSGAGIPVDVLDLTQCSDLDVDSLIPFLEDSNLYGLKVLWTRNGMSTSIQKFEHICGRSGSRTATPSTSTRHSPFMRSFAASTDSNPNPEPSYHQLPHKQPPQILHVPVDSSSQKEDTVSKSPHSPLGPARFVTDSELQWEIELRNLDLHTEQGRPSLDVEQPPQRSQDVWRTQGAIGNGLI